MPQGPYTGYGNYGDIPDEVMLARYESTCLPESPEQINYHFKEILRNEKPDAPFMEADAAFNGGYDPRTGEARQGGSYSRSFLARRDGGNRSHTEPFLPDGTFLDWHGLEKDPRSLMIGPDFQEMAKQEWARGRFIGFFPDADNSVPETGIAPDQFAQQIRGSQRWYQERMKWFDTAKDNRTHRRAGYSNLNEHRKIQVTVDGEVINLSDAVYSNRSNLTDLLANITKIGWRTTTDDDFKVAKYGRINPMSNIKDQAWFKNIRKGTVSERLPGVFQDQTVSKSLKIVMEGILRERKNRHKTLGDFPWQSEYGLKNFKQNLSAANYRGGSKIGYQSVEDRATEIVRLLQNSYVRRKNAMIALPARPDSKIGTSWIDPQLVSFMENSQRKVGPSEVTMNLKQAAIMAGSRGAIHLSDKDMGIKTQASKDDFKPTQASWLSKLFHPTDDSLVVANYMSINPTTMQPLQNLTNGENYKNNSYAMQNYTQNTAAATSAHSLVGGWITEDQEYAPEPVPGHGAKSLFGSKLTSMPNMITTHLDNRIDDEADTPSIYDRTTQPRASAQAHSRMINYTV